MIRKDAKELDKTPGIFNYFQFKDFLFKFQILGSSSEFQFEHKFVPHARKRRSIPHTRLLKSDPSVSMSFIFIY